MVRGSFQKRVPDRKSRKQKNRKIEKSSSPKDQNDLLGARGGGLGSRPKKMYGERLGDGVEYHLMKPTPLRGRRITLCVFEREGE